MEKELSFESNAPQKAIDRIRTQSNEERSKYIIDVFVKCFGDGIESNPTAFYTRFQKMTTTAFTFYRGSAVLFYHDLKVDQDPWIHGHKAAGNVFIHGDLHVENFGSYLNRHGILNFNVNDFDEGYCGPFTWDIKRILASLNLKAYSKGFSDAEIKQILEVCAEEYVKQINEFCEKSKGHYSLTLKNTSGKIKKLLNEALVKSYFMHLEKMTAIENYNRRFIRSEDIQDVDDDLRVKIMKAFEEYFESIPTSKKKAIRDDSGINFNVKDIVVRPSPGIGSGGKTSYSILIEGRTEALEDDIVLYMKPAQKAAISCVLQVPELEKYFQHDGLRTVLCSYAMQASTPKWLDYTTLDTVSCLVDEVKTHAKDLDWDEINDIKDVIEVVKYLGQVTAMMHCVADSDCTNTPDDVACLPFSVIPQETEKTIRDAIQGRDQEFIADMVEFGMVYGAQVRRDYHLFFEIFRNKRIPGLQ